MKLCPKCNAQLNDNAAFCTNCGAQFVQQQQYQQQYQPAYDPYDHTHEFDPKDISDNKVISMLVYLMGWVGIIIALLGSNTSKYAAFHVRQALKFVVIETLTTLCMAFLFWTLIVPLAGAIFFVVLFVVKIICFFQICQGKAKEPPIIKAFDFLR